MINYTHEPTPVTITDLPVRSPNQLERTDPDNKPDQISPADWTALGSDPRLAESWSVIANPGVQHTEQALMKLVCRSDRRHILNCAIPLTRGQASTDFDLPEGPQIRDCFAATVTGKFPDALKEWEYTPQIHAVGRGNSGPTNDRWREVADAFPRRQSHARTFHTERNQPVLKINPQLP